MHGCFAPRSMYSTVNRKGITLLAEHKHISVSKGRLQILRGTLSLARYHTSPQSLLFRQCSLLSEKPDTALPTCEAIRSEANIRAISPKPDVNTCTFRKPPSREKQWAQMLVFKFQRTLQVSAKEVISSGHFCKPAGENLTRYVQHGIVPQNLLNITWRYDTVWQEKNP